MISSVMTKMSDKDVIESWLRLYNRELGTSFHVADWPDLRNPTEKAIDAVCEDPSGNRFTRAVERG